MSYLYVLHVIWSTTNCRCIDGMANKIRNKNNELKPEVYKLIELYLF